MLKILTLFIFSSLLLLASCTLNQSKFSTDKGSQLPQETQEAIVDESQSRVVLSRARIIADILYEAKYALDDNKLLLPTGDNAYDRYREVLDIEPENAVAIQGIQEVVLKYVQLANSAMSQGQYEEATSLLNRGASIDSTNAEVQVARMRLLETRKVKVDFIALDPAGLSEQRLETLVALAEIAEQVRLVEATFLITARTDEEGRWIYKTMRESVGGYRLRGNIILGSEPGVRINAPSSLPI